MLPMVEAAIINPNAKKRAAEKIPFPKGKKLYFTNLLSHLLMKIVWLASAQTLLERSALSQNAMNSQEFIQMMYSLR